MEKLTKTKVLEPANPNKATKLFGGKSSGILNFNDLKYPHFYKLREEIRNLFWSANEINMIDDAKHFKTLTEREKDAFLKIIGLLATLDAPQTKIADLVRQYTTDPSVTSIMATISDQESEHNHSYSYVLSSLVTLEVQNQAFELGRTDEVLMKRNSHIMKIYNDFVDNPTIENLLKVLVEMNILEGLFFYSGFAFFYNLARNGKMFGTSTMISYINREELKHGKFASELYRATLAEHPEYNTEKQAEWVYDSIRHAVEQEKIWANYAIDGIDGIWMEEMEGYIEFRANKILRLLGLSEIYEDNIKNPMKWINAYVDSFDDTKTDFFEQKSRQYTKVGSNNGFNDIDETEKEKENDDLNGFDEL